MGNVHCVNKKDSAARYKGFAIQYTETKLTQSELRISSTVEGIQNR